ncbi:MAG: hypothetical protein KZQ88_11630 [Candidatus Thiodiazotropha sp. (ex Dulcina madagascariensis)]|nr:hypothetical protein [Candidatus Thiodiazotropha sp. (ex Dulcina madagascariensis)]MCU7926652.1 hypothetical protein [Candidatus Thiodiazotropha sp. (ex Dulcina madagascariensis)]
MIAGRVIPGGLIINLTISIILMLPGVKYARKQGYVRTEGWFIGVAEFRTATVEALTEFGFDDSDEREPPTLF